MPPTRSIAPVAQRLSPEFGLYIRTCQSGGKRSPLAIRLRNKIVSDNANLAKLVAHRFEQKCREPYSDLEQVGLLGLIKAVERYNPATGYSFSSYAVSLASGEILHYLRDKVSTIRVPRSLQELYSKGRSIRSAIAATGQSPTDRDIAIALKISESQWKECQGIYSRGLFRSVEDWENEPLILIESIREGDRDLGEEVRLLRKAIASLGEESAISKLFKPERAGRCVPMAKVYRLRKDLGAIAGFLKKQNCSSI
ncbi:MAG TPA: hypothetical protein DD990_17500 [Cyanobacteria bacterium UBA11368]|nr:hypothetical protein [Cyanobacteria bacterium UBA11368]